uniref:NADH-ubiquinone oxidoreductase chain 6 n=1 Tax=Corethrella condita TaxID=2527952 RepID=A0A411NHI1_9DIPT|nr:NADH dehydrogenase subunit 6 [Corethrella condita]
MMLLFLLAISVLISILFIQMNHPLAMGIILLIQTFSICLITGIFSKTFWFSYTLFLIFLGGMLVLFIYVTSLASNEMFNLSLKLLTIFIYSTLIIMMISFLADKFYNFTSNFNLEMKILENLFSENSISLNKLYNFPTNMITLMLINYLFLTLIATVKITNIYRGPLRPMN